MRDDEQEMMGVTQNDLNAISSLLYFYERHLWHFSTPSVKRTRNLIGVQFLLVKIQLLTSTKIATFTPMEIAYIEEALRIFVVQAKEKIPPSPSRDNVLESCEGLRLVIRNILR